MNNDEEQVPTEALDQVEEEMIDQLEQQSAKVVVEARKHGRVGILSHAVLSKSNRSAAAVHTLEYEKKSQSYATRNNPDMPMNSCIFDSQNRPSEKKGAESVP